VAKNKEVIVVHFEDEPWDVTFILKDLRQIVIDPDTERPASDVQLIMGRTGPNDFPSKSVLKWRREGVDYQIAYWLVEHADQLKGIEDFENATTFIIDVVRTNNNGRGVSAWRQLLESVSSKLSSVEEQVRLYTNFDVDVHDDGAIATPGRTKMKPPPVIKKGDPSLYDFILGRVGWIADAE
jgi:hypothetical protein